MFRSSFLSTILIIFLKFYLLFNSLDPCLYSNWDKYYTESFLWHCQYLIFVWQAFLAILGFPALCDKTLGQLYEKLGLKLGFFCTFAACICFLFFFSVLSKTIRLLATLDSHKGQRHNKKKIFVTNDKRRFEESIQLLGLANQSWKDNRLSVLPLWLIID